MKNKILTYLSKYTVITKALAEAIEESTFIQHFEKGTILLQEGSISNNCYFILEGCVRSYLVKNGEEKTIEFYTEEQVVTPANYGSNLPSRYTLACLEDTIACVGNPALEQATFEKFPALAALSGVIAEKIMAQQQEAFADFKTSSPEERYLNLLATRPDLIQRAPQYQIASYLGITPESLSRIRKRLHDKKQVLNERQ